MKREVNALDAIRDLLGESSRSLRAERFLASALFDLRRGVDRAAAQVERRSETLGRSGPRYQQHVQMQSRQPCL